MKKDPVQYSNRNTTKLIILKDEGKQVQCNKMGGRRGRTKDRINERK